MIYLQEGIYKQELVFNTVAAGIATLREKWLLAAFSTDHSLFYAAKIWKTAVLSQAVKYIWSLAKEGGNLT